MNAPGPMRVYFVVPEAIDDDARVSGGNVYDRHVRDGLRSSGWDVRMILIGDSSPTAQAFAQLPDGALALIDGLIAVDESGTLVAEASRLRMVVLAHMVWGVDGEREALHAARAVVATSEWTRSELTSRDLVAPGVVVVARPGADPAPATVASASGGRLLCVGVLAAHKGQDLLVHALARLTDIEGWTCTIAGALDTAPHFVGEVTSTLQRSHLTPRVTLAGALAGASLERAYGSADLVIVPSRNESFGMVVTEALARGIPVVAGRVGGIAEAMSGNRGGMLVPADDPWALEVVLRQWLTGSEHRAELKAAAMDARQAVRLWSETIAVIAAALQSVLASVPPSVFPAAPPAVPPSVFSEATVTDHALSNETAPSA